VRVVVEDVIHEGGFAGAEEAGEDGDWNFLAGHRECGIMVLVSVCLCLCEFPKFGMKCNMRNNEL